ncbi:glycine cleavage system protein T [Shewanella sp. UCD-FRSSP16_17]|uniref:tRNA-modifying protein YgfZ n=1 Tax=unclassified Shewanella TaxID=196818 RepID=UPI0007EEE901|nr:MULTISPECIES: tRNA-modifying protein YgfZ [unclassified Shewanella]MBQ4890538.1 tRNA-modifying protein YgfZ [Shewanella sp. MMG014]OBT06942.1 glycine cleavage system protein T [Shewanella sp. UCD-FRSSP16_17]
MTLATTQPDWDFLHTSPDLFVANLTHLGLIEITGEQGKTFIHGQVTTDITSLTDQQWRWGAHCDAKGKMISSFRTFSCNDSLFTLHTASALPLSLAQWQKYAVFSKAELTDISASKCIIGIAGNTASQFVEQEFGAINDELTVVDNSIILKDNDRFILILNEDIASKVIAASKQPLLNASAWQALEIKAGYANIDANHSAEFVPQMCNVQAVNGISFEKGCYMGQETIARMKYRGGNKRALYILSGTASDTVNSETQIEVQMDGDYRRAGKVIESVQYNGQVLLTAVLANDTDNDAVLRISDDSDSLLSVVPLPYSLDDE